MKSLRMVTYPSIIIYVNKTERAGRQINYLTLQRFCRYFAGIGDRTGPPPVTQTAGTGQGRVRATVPRAAGRSQGPAGGARQPGTSAARGG